MLNDVAHGDSVGSQNTVGIKSLLYTNMILLADQRWVERVLATDRCTPHELRLVAVKLQSTGSHPVGYSVGTVDY